VVSVNKENVAAAAGSSSADVTAMEVQATDSLNQIASESTPDVKPVAGNMTEACFTVAL